MLNVTTVISTSFETAKRFIKVLRIGKSDVQNVKEMMPFGIDGNPIEGMAAIYASTGIKGKNYILGYINKNQLAEPGELRLYSLDANGKEKTYQYFKKDGTIEMLGNDDNMVRYSKLEQAYNQLKTDHDELVTTFNAHTATVALILFTPVSTLAASTGDISGAKINEIKTKST